MFQGEKPSKTDPKSTQDAGNQDTKVVTADPAQAAAVVTEVDETLSQDGGTDEQGADPYANWTKEDYITQMKSAREEAAKARVEKKEMEKNLTESLNKQLAEIEKKFTPIIEQANALKKKEEADKDKNRSLEEKLSDRELRLKTTLDEKQAIEDSMRAKVGELESKLEKLSTDVQTYESIYQKELDKELAEVPQKSKYLADMIVKASSGNVQEALLAIKQAKIDGAFGAKKVQVFNATPGATNGGRMSAASAQQDPAKMTKNQKLEAGLKAWKTKVRQRGIGDL